MAKAYPQGKGWAIRAHYQCNDIYECGPDKGEVERAVRDRMAAIDAVGAPVGRGPKRTTAAQAMQDYALQRLPFKKGALQEAVRMNHYLRAAGLQTLVVTRLAAPSAGEKSKQTYFNVTLEPHSDIRTIAPGLGGHRKTQMTKTADARKHRAVLACKSLASVRRIDMQNYMDAMRAEGAAPATMKLEQALWRGLFNHAFTQWHWKSLVDNPATKLKMPQVDNERERVMSEQEQALMDASFAGCRNDLVAPVVTLLRETAMRSSEPLQMACWSDVDWEAKVLTLRDSKTLRRNVPLSPLALQALQTLRQMGESEPDDKIVKISYEALKASWTRACNRAGIKNLKIHDLRHTAATRMALKTGNLFLVMALTGHKTVVSVMRYTNVKAQDVVKVMHGPVTAEPVSSAPLATAVTSPGPALEQPAAAAPLVNSRQFEEAVVLATREVMRQLQLQPQGKQPEQGHCSAPQQQAHDPLPGETGVNNLLQFARRAA